jgi:hypothetical protein
VTPKSSTESKREFTPTPSPLVRFQMCPWVISESECGSIHRVGRFQIFFGEPRVWMSQFSGLRQYVKRFNKFNAA